MRGDIFSKTVFSEEFCSSFADEIDGEFDKLLVNVFGAVVLAGFVGEYCCLFFVGVFCSAFFVGLFDSSPGSLGVSQPEF